MAEGLGYVRMQPPNLEDNLSDPSDPLKPATATPLNPRRRGIIIGASAGLGAELARKLAREGYALALLARTKDTLTNLPNRRALDERLEEEVLSARKNNYSFAVVMMDLDGFKDVNDTYGHPVGDDVLRLVFSQMARGVRNTDFLARYGGDELTLILTQSDMSSSKIVAEKIVEGMKKLKFKLPDGKKLNLGISGGIALFPVNARSGPDLLRAADAALYKAKKYDRGTFQVARGITGPLATHNIVGE